MTRQIGPWVRTVRHLRPAQVAHRVRLRGLRVIDPWVSCYRRAPEQLVGCWPDKYTSVDSQCDWGDPDAIAVGRFTFLHEERDLGQPADWVQAGTAHLWRFNLHYMEWARALAADDPPRRGDFARLWRSWSSRVTIAHRDAWSPYVASLRAWVLCDTFERLVRGTALEAEMLAALWQHRTFLRLHLELDVGGNHLLKNVKALLGLAGFFDDPEGWAWAARRLEKEIAIQVLADGGHYELSPSYHCQVLGDLLDIAGLQAATGLSPVGGLAYAIDRMRDWIGAMVGSTDELPMFNDCWQIGQERLALLGPHRRTDRLIVLAESGYVVMNPSPFVHLVMDVGDPCPPSLPAHAHADCLSFELYLDGERVIVNSGTSTYEPGERRDFERSTAAHNTVVVEGQSQTEVWGTFRAGRRAHGRLHCVEDDGATITVVASHDGYEHLPGSPTHRRSLTLEPSRLEIADVVDGRGRHRAKSALYLSPKARRRLTVANTGRTPGMVATGFGKTVDADVLNSEAGPLDGPVELTSSVRW